MQIDSFDPRMCPKAAQDWREALAEGVRGPDGPFLNFVTDEQLFAPETRLFAARDRGGAIVGISRLCFPKRPEGILTSVWVRPGHRKYGVGHALMRATFVFALAQGVSTIGLIVRLTDAGLGKAAKLYGSVGYSLLPGVECRLLGNGLDEQHLWPTADDGGTIRGRAMMISEVEMRRALRNAAA